MGEQAVGEREGGTSLPSWGIRGGYTDFYETTAHFIRAVLCKARKWFVFSEGNEQVLLMGSRQLWKAAPRETSHRERERRGGRARWAGVEQWAAI